MSADATQTGIWVSFCPFRLCLTCCAQRARLTPSWASPAPSPAKQRSLWAETGNVIQTSTKALLPLPRSPVIMMTMPLLGCAIMNCSSVYSCNGMTDMRC